KNRTIFEDVPVNKWFTEYVLEAYYNGVINGYKDREGNFLYKYGPADSVTIAEVAKIFTSSIGALVPDATDKVPEEYKKHWGAKWINWLIDHEYYLTQYNKNPDRPATREEVLRFTLEFFYDLTGMKEFLETNEVHSLMNYTLPDIDTKNKIYIQIGYDFKIIDDHDDGYFRPTDYINRAEIVKILERAKDRDLLRKTVSIPKNICH
ncbi:MAG: S-layer homology domain-containing protein, partial [bacterium]|nr:S-layer homology domain-containing protein [bacterium]